MNLANDNYLGQSAHPYMDKLFVAGCILIAIALTYAITSANEMANSLSEIEMEVLADLN